MFLTAIIDWYSRKIVGWELCSIDTLPVIAAVGKAVEKYGIPGIISSHQGAQFTSKEYKTFLRLLCIRQSMDGKSRWANNVMVERWLHSLKTEKLDINEFQSPKELRIAIREHIEEYNTIIMRLMTTQPRVKYISESSAWLHS